MINMKMIHNIPSLIFQVCLTQDHKAKTIIIQTKILKKLQIENLFKKIKTIYQIQIPSK